MVDFQHKTHLDAPALVAERGSSTLLSPRSAASSEKLKIGSEACPSRQSCPRWVTSDRAYGQAARPDVRYTFNSDQTAKCRKGPFADMALKAAGARGALIASSTSALTATQPLDGTRSFVPKSHLLATSGAHVESPKNKV
jgi:hypothetical protein